MTHIRPLRLLLLIFIALLSVSAAPRQTAAQAAPPSQDEWIRLAEQFLNDLRQERWSEAQAMLDQRMAAYFTGNKLAETWQGVQSQAGKFQAILSEQQQEQQGLHIVDLTSKFEKATLKVRVVFSADRKVSGLWFLPAEPPPYNAPAYVDRNSFREVDVTIGTEPWKLPGTLSIPVGEGPYPGVVLVHGSGPNDRDETIGPNRPFRDLAWGLASQGIAVLRYDKRTRVYRDQMKGIQVTVENEVIEDALAALRLLRQRPEIDSARVFLLGHSLGAILAPEIALRDGRLAGVIMLAAAARPLGVVTLEQIEYIASLDQAAGQARYDTLIAKLKKLIQGKLPPQESMLGAPAAYFYDLKKRDEVAVARQLSIPMLILQGGRDYQVTTEDFNLWKKAIGDKKNASFKLYPDLNHLFMTGQGKATPQEYQRSGHVDARVIADIAAWIRER